MQDGSDFTANCGMVPDGAENGPHQLERDEVSENEHTDAAGTTDQVAAEILGRPVLQSQPDFYRSFRARPSGGYRDGCTLTERGGSPCRDIWIGELMLRN